MQAVMETAFDILYLCTVCILGITMIRKARGNRMLFLFGIMAVTLGLGDAFHLIPRAYALCTDGLAAHTAALGIGKFITSITMTIFYLLLFRIWELRYNRHRPLLRTGMYLLALLRMALCFFPQNAWTSPNAPLSWGILRNVPFALMGLWIIVLFYQQAKQKEDFVFKYMWLAITLSFLFYIPVVLWADTLPMIGMLMIPKTLAYVWVVWMGYQMMKKELNYLLKKQSILHFYMRFSP